MIQISERAKTVHALDRSATVTDLILFGGGGELLFILRIVRNKQIHICLLPASRFLNSLFFDPIDGDKFLRIIG
jgi:hypothetical protein